MNNPTNMDHRIVSFNLDDDLVKRMDARTRQLDTDRSKYVRGLIRADLAVALAAVKPRRKPNQLRKGSRV